MNIFKKIFLIILGVIDLAVVAIACGYLKWGIDMPNTLAGRAMQFTGAYILSATYFAVALVVTIIFVVCLIKWKKRKFE